MRERAIQSAGKENVKRTTNNTRKRTTIGRIIAGVALTAALAPSAAFAATGTLVAVPQELVSLDAGNGDAVRESSDEGLSRLVAATQSAVTERRIEQEALAKASENLLTYDPAAIEAIGTQEATGHTICCPSFSCAYADAVLDGTVNDHSYYTCSCCSWTDWGGGDSSYRSVGTDEELLREAYDQIAAGRPTVIHVSAGYGEHWIALIGYTGVSDPNNLTLDNFIALDPWDGAQIIASDRFALYGDGCEHISER